MRRTSLTYHLGRLAAAGAVLLGLLLLLGRSAAADGAAPDPVASFEASNVPDQFIRHRNALGEISRISSELDRADATWVMRPALSGTPGAVSFESVNYPGTFLRHQSFRLKQHRNDNSDLFKQDASFHVRPGLAGGDTKSFEAVNVPGQFVRHQNFELWISAGDGSDLFKKDASFRQKPGLDGQVAMNVPRTFESVNYPGRYVRHRNTLGELTTVSTDLDMKDATWVMRPALSGTAGAVSFESSNYPGTFLRHQAFRIKQHRNDNSELFKKDASFYVRPGLSGLPGTVSFEAVNVPGHYIRHQNYQLWLAGRTAGNAPLFASDATFRQGGPSFRIDREVSLEAVNVSKQYLRHRLALGELTPVNPASNLDRADATWVVRPALSGIPGAVSFESKNYPGTFLRHQGFRLKQQGDDGADTHLFRMDASFYEKPALAGGPGKSYEAVNTPGHFIRHQNYQFWIAKNDGSDLFKKDASFLEQSRLYVEPGECTRFFRRWRDGREDEQLMATCTWIMGIEQYCAARDAFVAVAYYGDRPFRYLTCSPRSHPDTVLEQIDHIGRGVSQGLADAYVAAAPFLNPAISAVGCVNGVIYACAALALEIAERAGARPPGVVAEAFDIADQAGKCIDGNITACAQLGARGARAAGVNIPGEDAAKVVEDGQKCGRGDFAACVRLGLMAADAAGVPVGLGAGDIADASDCLLGNSDACIALAKTAVEAGTGIPLGGITQGAENARKCANGDNSACIELGKALVAATR